METPPRFAARSAYVAQDEALLLRLPGLSWLTPFLVSLLLCAGVALTPARTEAAYAATELARLPVGSSRIVRGGNDDDEIVGSARRGGGHRGFLLKSGPLQEIGGLLGSDYSAALGINNLGRVVGFANTTTGLRAFRSQRTTGIVALGTLPGDSGSAAFAINQPGQAVGYSSGRTGVRAVVWTPAGAIQALPVLPGCDSARGLAINDRGDVVGVCDTVSGPRAVLWEGDAVQDLGTLPGDTSSEALSINANGVIVGSSGDPESQHHAVLWPSGGGPIQDLGTLPDGASSRALAINNGGEVVGISEASAGDHAFRWTEQDGMQDLNFMLTSRFGFVLTHAVAISARGVIVAIGVDEATSPEQRHDHDDHELPLRVFRLVPVR
jgi:probable HAF family extracellular repeat protein